MDDDLKILEAELQQLRPRAPSAGLHGRLQRALAPAPARPAPPRRTTLSPLWWWIALPAAAAGVLLFRFGAEEHPAPAPGAAPAAPLATASDTLKPVAAQNVLYAAADEGLVTLDDGTTARRERLHFVDTITWRNPRTNASLTWSVPREEVRIVPVNFQ